MVPQTAFELNLVPILRMESGKEKSVGKRGSVDGTVPDEEEKAYPLKIDVFKGAPAK